MEILEALCCKKPVLLRDVPMYQDILFDHYLKGKEVEEFVKVLFQLNEDETMYLKWCEKSWVCHHLYLEENSLKQWKSFYSRAAQLRESRHD